MGHTLKKTCVVLSVIFAITQIIRIILTNQLESMKSSRNLLSQPFAFNFTETKFKFLRHIDESSVLDSSGQYQVVPFLFRASNLGSSNHIKKDVGLVSQTSSNQILFIRDLSIRWQGFLSVAIFSGDSDLESIVEKIVLLFACHPDIRFNTSIHLVFPLKQRNSRGISLKETKDCDYIYQMQEEHISYSTPQVPYPINLLRNVARRHSMTEFIFVTDIDLIPSANFRSQFLTFASKNNLFHESKFGDRSVYVVPTYETSEYLIQTGIPGDKKSLVDGINRKEVRPFYAEVCWKCHKHTNYKSWEEAPTSKSVEVLYEVTWQDPWEPFYISRASVPMYDERFKQYGFNRVSQVYELHITGYKFLVLNNLFLIHRGLKEPDSFHDLKDEDQERNRILFRQFKNDLKEKYSLEKKIS